MIGERRSFWRKAAPPLPQICQCGSRPPPHLSRLFTGGEAARRSVSRTAVNNERSLSSSFVQSGACVHRNNRRHPVRESRRSAFSRFPVSLFSFEIYTIGEICIRECCGQGFDKRKSLWKGKDGVWGREGKAFLQKSFPSLPQCFKGAAYAQSCLSQGSRLSRWMTDSIRTRASLSFLISSSLRLGFFIT